MSSMTENKEYNPLDIMQIPSPPSDDEKPSATSSTMLIVDNLREFCYFPIYLHQFIFTFPIVQLKFDLTLKFVTNQFPIRHVHWKL